MEAAKGGLRSPHAARDCFRQPEVAEGGRRRPKAAKGRGRRPGITLKAIGRPPKAAKDRGGRRPARTLVAAEGGLWPHLSAGGRRELQARRRRMEASGSWRPLKTARGCKVKAHFKALRPRYVRKHKAQVCISAGLPKTSQYYQMPNYFRQARQE